MSAMNVLYDFIIFRMERRGGISRYIAELASRLAASGSAATTILAGIHDNDFLADRSLMRGVRIVGFRRPTALARSKAAGALDYAVLAAYHRFGRRTHIYHPSYYPRKLTVPRGARIVATVYDMIHERLPEYHVGDPTPSRKRVLVSAADVILCISTTTANDLTSYYGVEPSRIRITHLGAGVGTRSASHSVRLDERINSRPYFIHVGRRSGYKNFRLLLEAYVSDATLRERTALIAVGGEEWTQDEQQLIASAGTDGLVLRTDADDGALRILYRNALALVVPSLYEGFGLAAVEAMGEGCPVIANATGSLPEVIGDAGIVVAMTDAGILVASMQQMLDEGPLSGELRRKGHDRVTMFDWSQTASQTLDAYRSVVASD